jgi:hypothetical protein
LSAGSVKLAEFLVLGVGQSAYIIKTHDLDSEGSNFLVLGPLLGLVVQHIIKFRGLKNAKYIEIYHICSLFMLFYFF